MLRQLFHTGLISEDRAFGTLTGRVDSENSEFAAFLTEYVHAELIDRGGLAGTWYATDTYTDAVATIRQTLVDDLLGTGLMVGVDTLDKGDSLREHGDIALKDAFHHLCR